MAEERSLFLIDNGTLRFIQEWMQSTALLSLISSPIRPPSTRLEKLEFHVLPWVKHNGLYPGLLLHLCSPPVMIGVIRYQVKEGNFWNCNRKKLIFFLYSCINLFFCHL